MDNGMKYNSITEYYKQTFGGRVYKLALDIGATCPNRDGSKGTGGCIYCSGAGSGDYATVFTQLDCAKSKLKAFFRFFIIVAQASGFCAF